MKNNFCKHSRAAQTLLLFGLTAVAAFAQSVEKLGENGAQHAGEMATRIINVLFVLACAFCGGFVAYWALRLRSKKPRRRPAQMLFLFALTAVVAFAQSGDLSAATAPIETAGVNVVKLVAALVLLACVGVIMYGAATLGANKPRALAMIAGGIVGGIIAGAAYTLVGTTSGATVPTAFLVIPFLG